MHLRMMNNQANLSRYNPNKCFFYGLKSRGDLERFLLLHQNQLRNADRLVCYQSKSVPKKNGKMREINDPSPKLKAMQRKILVQLKRLDLPEWIFSGVKSRSYIDNAKYHLGAPYMVKIDIEKFYPNCRSIRAYQLFVNGFKTSTDIAGILTKLLTYKQSFPTGTPTSQMIAFLAYNDMFCEMEQKASERGYRFSLFIDDITFSSSTEIPREFIKDIEAVLNKYGHSLNMRKVKTYYSTQDKLVTGAVVTRDSKMAVPNRQRQLIVADLNEIKCLFSLAKASGADCKSEANSQLLVKWRSATGRLQSARQIESGLYSGIKLYYLQVQKYLKNEHLL